MRRPREKRAGAFFVVGAFPGESICGQNAGKRRKTLTDSMFQNILAQINSTYEIWHQHISVYLAVYQ